MPRSIIIIICLRVRIEKSGSCVIACSGPGTPVRHFFLYLPFQTGALARTGICGNRGGNYREVGDIPWGGIFYVRGPFPIALAIAERADLARSFANHRPIFHACRILQ